MTVFLIANGALTGSNPRSPRRATAMERGLYGVYAQGFQSSIAPKSDRNTFNPSYSIISSRSNPRSPRRATAMTVFLIANGALTGSNPRSPRRATAMERGLYGVYAQGFQSSIAPKSDRNTFNPSYSIISSRSNPRSPRRATAMSSVTLWGFYMRSNPRSPRRATAIGGVSAMAQGVGSNPRSPRRATAIHTQRD